MSVVAKIHAAARRATMRDFLGMLALQEANLLENLVDAERASGFLSARFNAEQFSRMNHDACIIVAEHDDRIVGYACCADVEYSRQFPILAAMIATFDRHTYLGNPLIDSRAVIYGPVCVDRALRGRGIFRQLIRGIKVELSGRFDVAVAFIAKVNTHSLTAHVDGLGMTTVGEFSLDGRNFWIIAFSIPAADVACGVRPSST